MVGDMAAGTDELPHRGSTLQVRPAAITDPAADKRQPTADAGGQLGSGRTALAASPTSVRLSS
jgi:hypothetical protein